MAVFTLPPEMIHFYKENIDYISNHAVDPDKRRYAVKGEGARHYIDVDHYIVNDEDPFLLLPQRWNAAVNKYSEDTLKTYGIVPWHVNLMVIRLTKAFEEKNKTKILSLSADLGHYIADSHVPLHTTENYNGQLTNQKGIHGFWESRLPELKHEEYNYFVGKAVYVNNVLADEWETIRQSFSAKDSVLELEQQLNNNFPKDQKYTYENRGKKVVKVYAEAYATSYHNMMNGMVERRLTQSISKVGSYWYTAWVNAGQPNLDELLDKKAAQQLKKENKVLDSLYNLSNIKGRAHE